MKQPTHGSASDFNLSCPNHPDPTHRNRAPQPKYFPRRILTLALEFWVNQNSILTGALPKPNKPKPNRPCPNPSSRQAHRRNHPRNLPTQPLPPSRPHSPSPPPLQPRSRPTPAIPLHLRPPPPNPLLLPSQLHHVEPPNFTPTETLARDLECIERSRGQAQVFSSHGDGGTSESRGGGKHGGQTRWADAAIQQAAAFTDAALLGTARPVGHRVRAPPTSLALSGPPPRSSSIPGRHTPTKTPGWFHVLFLPVYLLQ
jgi:hypothetical protein